MKRLLLLIMGVIAFNSGYSFNIKKLNAENGLSNNNVVSIAQDRDGFLWFATKDGLNRFDGNMFQIFRHSDTDSNSICSNVLNCVYADPTDDAVWIASEKNGMDAYNYKTCKFTHYVNNTKLANHISADGITHISGDKVGNLWIATYSGGFNFLDKRTGKFTHYNQSNIRGLGSNLNWYIMPDTDTRIYVGHVGNGLSIVNPQKRTALNYFNVPQNPSSLSDNTVTCIFKDFRNKIWIGTRNGLNLFDVKTGKFIRFQNHPDNITGLSHNFIKSIVETPDHKLWIGTEGGGINIFDNSKITAYQHPYFQHIASSYIPGELSSTSIQALIRDSYGNFWTGGFIKGVNFISSKVDKFNRISFLPLIGNYHSLGNTIVAGLSKDANNNIWIANGIGGLYLYNKQKNLLKKQNLTIKPPHDITCVLQDPYQNDLLWFGTTDGRICNYHKKSGKSIVLPLFNSIRNTMIYNLFIDSHKILWVSTDIGLGKLNTINNKAEFFNTLNSPLNDDNIRSVAEDCEGNIWVGTQGGFLQIFDINLKQLYNLSRKSNFFEISHIYRDSRNRMWIASQNDFFVFDRPFSSPTIRIGKKNGLAENVIISLAEGKTADEVWLSSTNYISYINLKSQTTKNFNATDGIAPGDYMKACVIKSSDGTLYFGSQNGITWFDGQLDDKDQTNLVAKISLLRVADKQKQHLTDFVDFPFSEKVKLSYTQNTFQICFNVPDYSISTKAEFMYQFEGLDDSWYFIGKEKQVTFRNLLPGKYTFNIKSRLQNREWSNQITSITIVVNPPFWLTWWARTIYLLALLVVLYYIIRFYKNKLELENALVIETINHQQEQKLNEEKMRFFTNIAHELRTPMTLIIGPVEDMISEKSVPELFVKRVNSIHRTANRLLHLINQILEFRKTETNNRTLTVTKGNIITSIYEIGLRYKELYQNKNVSFEIKLPDNTIEMYYDQEVITVVMDNLISNAFKYTVNGKITIEVKETSDTNIDYVEISVSDTGIGINDEELPYIFNRYYQATNRLQQTTGTGIGLALVKNLVDLHEAEILVESELNTGTTFIVKLLKNNTYPDAIHKDIVEYQYNDMKIEDESSKQLVLVVEDNSEIADYIHDCFTYSYDVITADNGKTGYELACLRTPDIIISDVLMPIMNGIELCQNLKQSMPTSHIPVILLTAKGTQLDKTEGYNAGADSYMTKPFSGNLLKSRVKNLLLNRTRLNDSNASFRNKKIILQDSANQLDKDFIEKVTSIIEQNIENENISIGMIAGILNMSHSSFYRKIKALTDLTANEFIRKVRMKSAEQLLLTNKYSINEIMYQVGMNSSSHFRQCFKDEFGVLPSEYIQKLKEEN